MTIHLDISQLILDPRRSGIQRAERELIRYWPGPAVLQPCRFDAGLGEMVSLPLDVFHILCADAPPGGVEAERTLLAPHLGSAIVIRPERLLNAELFVDPARAAYYRRCHAPCRPFWLVYDFLPWLHPDWFSTGSAARLMHYLRALREVEDVSFISASTRADYTQRIVRRPATGPVIAMGGDGLGLEPQAFSSQRKTFIMLGTIEPRKNAAQAIQAFQRLWNQGVDAKLTMIGATSPDATAELALLKAVAGDPRFTHLRNLPDGGVRQALRGARAMLFPSEGEGYGIPPMEALHAGIPVIVSAALPALADQPSLGQIRLDRVTPDTVADAVLTLMDDERCAAAWSEAAEMRVPGWHDFAEAVAEWVQS